MRRERAGSTGSGGGTDAVVVTSAGRGGGAVLRGGSGDGGTLEASLVNMARAANRLAVEQNHAVIAAAATQIFAKNTSALAVAQEKLAG